MNGPDPQNPKPLPAPPPGVTFVDVQSPTLPPAPPGVKFVDDGAAAGSSAQGAPGTFASEYPRLAAVGSAAKSALNTIERGANNLVGGAASSLAALPQRLAELPGLKQINSIDPTRRIIGPAYEKMQAAIAPPDPNSMAAKTGAGLEQAGEMALLGPERLGLDLAGPSVARMAARVGAGAAVPAIVAAAHGEKPLPAAIAGGAGAAAIESVPNIANALRQSAMNQYGRVLAPTTKAAKVMAGDILAGRPGVSGLLDRGVVATSGKALEDRAADVTDSLGAKIGSAVAKIPAEEKVSTAPILSAISKYRDGFVVNGVPVNAAGAKAADDLAEMVQRLGGPGGELSYADLNKARQILDTAVSKAKGYAGANFAEGSTLDAQREAANSMRDTLAKDRPDIARLNAQFHFWRQVQDVIGATNQRRIGQQGGLLTAIGHPVLAATGAAAGFGAGGATGAGEGAGIALAASAAFHAVRSPLYRTASSVAKNALANALASGNAAAILRATANVLAGQVAARSQGEPAKPDSPKIDLGTIKYRPAKPLISTSAKGARH